MKRLPICFLMIVFCFTQAMSSEDPTEKIIEGSYVTVGASHYVDGKVNLKQWAEGYVMSSSLNKDGHVFEVLVFYEHVQGNYFTGNGKITVKYSNGKGCVHRFGSQIWAYWDHIYLRENMPRYIPYNPNGPCMAAGPYVWFNHEKPYYFVD